MSTDIQLLLEYRDIDGWRPALHLADRVADPRTHRGILNVCWWSVRSGRTSLFFGENALFPFHTGLPHDLSESMHSYVSPNFEGNPKYAGWIDLPDLDLESWPCKTVIVGGPVQLKYAPLFGDGRQPPPKDALLEQGIHEPVLEVVTNWKYERKLDFETIPSYKYHQLSPDFLVHVTWIESLPEFVGLIWHEGLAGLVGLDSPNRYRIVTCIG